MTIFFRTIFTLAFALYSGMSFAYSESICWDQDCVTKGWTEKGASQEIDHQCIRDNCHTNGLVKGNFDSGTYYSCLDSDCLTSGYYEIKRNSQTLLSQTVCIDSDCTKNGSMTYLPNGIKVLTCKDVDCVHNGWQSTLNGMLIEDVACLSSDCSRYGWINFR